MIVSLQGSSEHLPWAKCSKRADSTSRGEQIENQIAPGDRQQKCAGQTKRFLHWFSQFCTCVLKSSIQLRQGRRNPVDYSVRKGCPVSLTASGTSWERIPALNPRWGRYMASPLFLSTSLSAPGLSWDKALPAALTLAHTGQLGPLQPQRSNRKQTPYWRCTHL